MNSLQSALNGVIEGNIALFGRADRMVVQDRDIMAPVNNRDSSVKDTNSRSFRPH